jgi:hypothetical protein
VPPIGTSQFATWPIICVCIRKVREKCRDQTRLQIVLIGPLITKAISSNVEEPECFSVNIPNNGDSSGENLENNWPWQRRYALLLLGSKIWRSRRRSWRSVTNLEHLWIWYHNNLVNIRNWLCNLYPIIWNWFISWMMISAPSFTLSMESGQTVTKTEATNSKIVWNENHPQQHYWFLYELKIETAIHNWEVNGNWLGKIESSLSRSTTVTSFRCKPFILWIADLMIVTFPDFLHQAKWEIWCQATYGSSNCHCNSNISPTSVRWRSQIQGGVIFKSLSLGSETVNQRRKFLRTWSVTAIPPEFLNRAISECEKGPLVK